MTTRITLNMTGMDMMVAMSGGNPGAATVCMQLLRDEPKIDPDSALAGIGAILSLDSHGIYGSRIWMLYKDVCGEDLTRMIAVLRGYQMGQLGGATEDAINHAIDNYGEGLDVDKVLAAVKVELPDFAPQLVLGSK